MRGKPFELFRRWLISPAGAILAVAAVGLAPARLAAVPGDGDDGAELGPGCSPERPAIAHHAGGVIVENRRSKNPTPPIPCVTPTGWRTSEVGTVVTNSGSVLLQPGVGSPPTGLPIGVLRSVNRG